jgi:arsenate reductase
MSPQNLLFICFANTCRSPMAEAIARGLGGDMVSVFSAGLRPTGRVAPLSIATLSWLGFDPSGLRSKGFDAVPVRDMDYIVSLMGPHGLLELPGDLHAERIVWEIRDPYGEDESVYRATARTLQQRIKRLLDEILEKEPLFV